MSSDTYTIPRGQHPLHQAFSALAADGEDERQEAQERRGFARGPALQAGDHLRAEASTLLATILAEPNRPQMPEPLRAMAERIWAEHFRPSPPPATST